MIALTRKELGILSKVTHDITNSTGLARFGCVDSSPAFQIAALRVLLENTSSIMTTEDREMYRFLLCKMLEIHPKQDRVYIVQRNTAVFTEDPRFKRLLTTYAKMYNTNGPGFWLHNEFEYIIYALHLQIHRTARVAVIRADRLERLLRAYETQAKKEANNTAPVSVRAALVNEAMTTGSSLADRKQTVKDGLGTCYLCSAPKPRIIPCAVCGYTPRGTR